MRQVEKTWTHGQLCERAKRWLSGSMRCCPVFANCASCREIPDAIGWTSFWKYNGSIVVECKTSKPDFRADLNKNFEFRDMFGPIRFRNRRGMGPLERREVPRMGDFRFYMSEPGIVTAEMVTIQAPDHGLLHVIGRKVKIVVAAPRRAKPDCASEVRFLRFAIINKKQTEIPANFDSPLIQAVTHEH